MTFLKKSVALLLTVLLAFSGASILASASVALPTADYKVVLRHASSGAPVQDTKVEPGENIVADVYVGTNFAAGSGGIFLFYTRDFFEPGFTGDENVSGDYSDITAQASANYVVISARMNPVDAALLASNGYIYVSHQFGTTAVHTYLDPSKVLVSIPFKVKDDPTADEGAVFIGSTSGLAGNPGLTNVDVVADGYVGTVAGDPVLSRGGSIGNNNQNNVIDSGNNENCGSILNKVIFDSQGGTSQGTTYPLEKSGRIGTVINCETSVPSPSKDGQSFVGWYPQGTTDPDASDCVSSVKIDTTVNTYLALYAAANVTVTFDADGGCYDHNPAVTTKNVPQTAGAALAKPSAPTREGYNFMGWTATRGGTTPVSEVAPSADTTYYAMWEKASYTLAFDPDNGEASTTIPGLAFGDPLPSAPADPSKDGYRFLGWFEGSEEYAPGTMPARNVTYTAKYEAVVPAATYTANFNANGGKFADNTDTKTQSDIPSGTAPTNPGDPTKDGNVFGGWSDGTNTYSGSNLPAINDSNVNYTAVWTPEAPQAKKTITYYKEGTELYTTQEYTPGEAINLPTAPTKDGFTFKKWVLKDSNNDLPATMPDEDLIAVATWEPVEEETTVIFTVDGNEYTRLTGKPGSELTPPADPTKEGFKFAGWEPALPGSFPSDDTSYAARWIPEGTYTVTYFGGDGNVFRSYNATPGEKVPEPDEDPEFFGHRFVGWDPEIPTIMPEANLTFQSKWEVDPVFAAATIGTAAAAIGGITAASIAGATATGITLGSIAGGALILGLIASADTYTATFMVDGQVYRSYKLIAGTPIPTPLKAPTKDGCTFAGWDNKPDVMPDHDVVINAKWTANSGNYSEAIPQTGSTAGVTAFAVISTAAAAAFIYVSRKRKDDEI